MNDEIVNAIIFTVRGPIPAAAAARSFERTASIRGPRMLRRTAATNIPSSTITTSTISANAGVGVPLEPRNVAFGPTSIPNSFGSGTIVPLLPPAPQVPLSKPNCSIATIPATVRIARLTPRTRKAGSATTTPKAVANRMPRIAPSGKPIPWSSASFATTSPAIPPSPTWNSETCPTNPVITTSDRQTTAPISVRMVAERQSNGSTKNDTAQTLAKSERRRRGSAARPAPGAAAPR